MELKLVRWCHQRLSGILAYDNVSRLSRQSLLSANDKGDNDVKPGTMQISHGIYFTAEENPENPSLETV